MSTTKEHLFTAQPFCSPRAPHTNHSHTPHATRGFRVALLHRCLATPDPNGSVAAVRLGAFAARHGDARHLELRLLRSELRTDPAAGGVRNRCLHRRPTWTWNRSSEGCGTLRRRKKGKMGLGLERWAPFIRSWRGGNERSTNPTAFDVKTLLAPNASTGSIWVCHHSLRLTRIVGKPPEVPRKFQLRSLRVS